ncbi:MAG: hypothetical protein AB8G77_03390 [Rhodothermales bacterium]
MPRYLIIGCSGSGKSTLAEQISVLCRVPYINTDVLYWRSDWSVVSEEEVVESIDLKRESYVLDGNFVSSREKVWSEVDIIIWLDYDLHLIIFRLFVRNMRWWLARHSPWTGTPMGFRRAFSGLLHGLRSHGKKRKSYPGYLSSLSGKEIHVVSNPKKIANLLNELSIRCKG